MLADWLCRDSLERGDAAGFERKAEIAAGLRRFRVCARLPGCRVRDLRPWRGPDRRAHHARVDHPGRPDERGEYTKLDRGQSLRLLATVPVGRLIFTVGALPAVRPMNFALVGGLIVLRTAAGSTAARKIDGDIVVFQADELDAATSSGWSVTVTGRAALVDPEAVSRYQDAPLVPWAPGTRDQFITITTELAEGRRVRRPH